MCRGILKPFYILYNFIISIIRLSTESERPLPEGLASPSSTSGLTTAPGGDDIQGESNSALQGVKLDMSTLSALR